LIDYPVLLDQAPPRLRAYARETVVAEKFKAMVALGRANSRMKKDFYDIWALSRTHVFDPDRLARAIAATFERRGTPIPAEPPDALTPPSPPARRNRPSGGRLSLTSSWPPGPRRRGRRPGRVPDAAGAHGAVTCRLNWPPPAQGRHGSGADADDDRGAPTPLAVPPSSDHG
jgi:hypothetical protein